jgi:threonine/homoserine/homoserine lactone efflux protein
VDLAGFVVVATLVVITPGPDMALVARNTFSGGRFSGLATSAGTCSGLLVHASAAALGLSAVLLASSHAFTVVKIAGAAYLIFLGLRTIIGAGRDLPFRQRDKATDPWAAYRQGVLTNVLNPKVAVFFLSLLPQFVEPGPGFTLRLLLLSALFIAMGLVWLTVYTLALHGASAFVGRRPVRTVIETATGGVLMALGVRLALQRR